MAILPSVFHKISPAWVQHSMNLLVLLVLFVSSITCTRFLGPDRALHVLDFPLPASHGLGSEPSQPTWRLGQSPILAQFTCSTSTKSHFYASRNGCLTSREYS